jgi:hypothetical protein
MGRRVCRYAAARAESAWSLGASSLDALIKRERAHAGRSPMVHVTQ